MLVEARGHPWNRERFLLRKEVRISKIHAHLARIDSENESEDMKKWRNAALSRMRKDGRDNTTKKFDRMTRDMHPFERLEKYGVPV